MRTFPAVVLILLVTTLAGCHERSGPFGDKSYADLGWDGTAWPSLAGATVTILDHGAFGAFDDAAAAFEALTGAKVEHVAADDAGAALQRAVLEKGDPTFDVIYGIDNVLMARALEEGVFEPYTPVFASRVLPANVFFNAGAGSWPATPVDHGYIGINVDTHHAALDDANISDLDDVRDHADLFVTEDPRTSSPGLGFLVATIATYGEDDDDDFADYWTDLFDGGVLVTSGWTEAYEQHFSGGYGPEFAGGLGDRPIVTSYTTSPAYEHHFERPADQLATALVAPQSTLHQIETMGIAKGTHNLAAAQAWIEFTLTDAFQSLTAPLMAVYPVVADVDTQPVFGDIDPEPGTFTPARFTYAEIGANVERWVREWTDLCEAHDCA